MGQGACLFTGGLHFHNPWKGIPPPSDGRLPAPQMADPPLRRQTPFRRLAPPLQKAYPPQKADPFPVRIQILIRDTINKQAVCILLECILVILLFSSGNTVKLFSNNSLLLRQYHLFTVLKMGIPTLCHLIN